MREHGICARSSAAVSDEILFTLGLPMQISVRYINVPYRNFGPKTRGPNCSTVHKCTVLKTKGKAVCSAAWNGLKKLKSKYASAAFPRALSTPLLS
mgnify:CR=1 FL=1